jgi:hypothetical protein
MTKREKEKIEKNEIFEEMEEEIEQFETEE